jgi:hypothetical protein
MHWQHIAIGFMELRNLKAAVKYFAKAKEGYETIGDKVTLSELFAYLAQYYLEVQDVGVALQNAHISAKLAEATDVRDFIVRSKFMVGLASYKSGGKEDFGSALMTESIAMAEEHNIMALILDLVYLCARFQVIPCDSPKFLELTRWSVHTYLELGNSYRYDMTKTLLEKLEG